MPELLTPEEVRETLRISRPTLYRWCSDGTLPALRLPRGTLRFRREDIERVMRPMDVGKEGGHGSR